MNIEDQVVSLDLAKKLKELGVRQKSCFHWVEMNHETGIYRTVMEPQELHNTLACGFTVSELLNMIPADIDKCNLFLKKSTPSISMEAQYEAAYPGKNLCGNRDSNPANALAYLLIKLIEYKLVEVKNG